MTGARATNPQQALRRHPGRWRGLAHGEAAMTADEALQRLSGYINGYLGMSARQRPAVEWLLLAGADLADWTTRVTAVDLLGRLARDVDAAGRPLPGCWWEPLRVVTLREESVEDETQLLSVQIAATFASGPVQLAVTATGNRETAVVNIYHNGRLSRTATGAVGPDGAIASRATRTGP